MLELENALKMSYEHPWLEIKRNIETKCFLEINTQKEQRQKSSGLKFASYHEHKPQFNFNAKEKLKLVFKLVPEDIDCKQPQYSSESDSPSFSDPRKERQTEAGKLQQESMEGPVSPV